MKIQELINKLEQMKIIYGEEIEVCMVEDYDYLITEVENVEFKRTEDDFSCRSEYLKKNEIKNVIVLR